MKAASVVEIRKELAGLDKESIKQLCLRLARFKLENKELLTYLLFEADNEEGYINSIKTQLDDHFNEINTNSYFYIKKSVRKILRRVRKFSRYSNCPETEVELLLYVCHQMLKIKPSVLKNKTLTNRCEKKVRKAACKKSGTGGDPGRHESQK